MKAHRSSLITVAVAILALVGPVSCYAGTFNITANGKGTSATVYVSFAVGAYANLLTYTGTDSTGHAFSGQAVGEYSNGFVSCTFTAFGGVSETGVTLTLVGGSAITIIPGVGKLFVQASTGTGCINSTTGDFSISQTDSIVGGGGTYLNATGTQTDTFLGHNVGAPVSGSFNFEKFSSSLSITTP